MSGKSASVVAFVALLSAAATGSEGDVSAGRKLAFDVGKGNCLACHAVPGDPAAITSANVGPPLAQVGARFPERERLRRQIHDPMQFNPQTVMPPFGKHGILTAAEIEEIIDYLYSL